MKFYGKKLINKSFSIICSNCIGGIIYHRLGLKFLSPTINLWMNQQDFLKLVLDLKRYMELDLQFIETEYTYPVAKLEDITLHFNHYKTNQEAELCWVRRKARINYDNLYLIMYDKDNLNKEDLIMLKNVNCKGKIVISNNDYPDIEYVIKIDVDMSNPEKRYRLDLNKWTGKRKFEEKFDYVKWLNEGN